MNDLKEIPQRRKDTSKTNNNMKKKHCITSLLLLLIPLFGVAQATDKDCPFYKKYIDAGDLAIKQGNFEAAINAYSTAMVHCPENAKIASNKIKRFYMI